MGLGCSSAGIIEGYRAHTPGSAAYCSAPGAGIAFIGPYFHYAYRLVTILSRQQPHGALARTGAIFAEG